MINKKTKLQVGQNVSLKRIMRAYDVASMTKQQLETACQTFMAVWLFNSGANLGLTIRQETFNEANLETTLKHLRMLLNDDLTSCQTLREEVARSNESLFTAFSDATFRFTDKPDYHVPNLFTPILANYINNQNFFFEAAIKKVFEWRLNIGFGGVTQNDLTEIGIVPTVVKEVSGPAITFQDHLAMQALAETTASSEEAVKS